MPQVRQRLLKVLLVSLIFLLTPAQAQEAKTIRMGWTPWSGAETVTKLAKELLEQRLGYKVDLIYTGIGLQYQGLATGDLDVMLMAWLPTTHKIYWDKYSDRLEDLGVLYEDARLGWVVPAYVPEDELSSFEDLNKPEVKKKLGGTIQGIDVGAGLMQASESAVEEYGLDGYTLASSSEAGMTAALARAVQRSEWIVATAWSPHWMFSRWELRYLEEPKGILGTDERVHALGRKGFREDFPKVAKFLENFKIPTEDLQAISLRTGDSPHDEAIVNYIESHPELVNQWLQGVTE